MRFDFENLQPWQASTAMYLDVGNHLVTIRSATSDKNDNGNNRLTVIAGNNDGTCRDRIIYVEENGARKVVGLCVATGVRLPTEGDQDESGRLSQAYCDLFAGKQAGVVIRSEKGYNDPSKTFAVVKGWVHPTQINADIPADMPITEQSVSDDDDIPF